MSSSRKGPDTRVVAVVVDGYSFAINTGVGGSFVPEAFSKLIDFVFDEIAEKASAKVRIPARGRHIFFPDPTDANMKHIISDEACIKTHRFLHALKEMEWEVHTSNFKRVGNDWKASAEDLSMGQLCTTLSQPDCFDPVGADHNRLTLTDLVLVTADRDHLVTLNAPTATAGGNSVLRWCVVPSTQPVSSSLRDWGRSRERLLIFPVNGGRQQHHAALPPPPPPAAPSAAAAAPALPSYSAHIRGANSSAVDKKKGPATPIRILARPTASTASTNSAAQATAPPAATSKMAMFCCLCSKRCEPLTEGVCCSNHPPYHHITCGQCLASVALDKDPSTPINCLAEDCACQLPFDEIALLLPGATSSRSERDEGESSMDPGTTIATVVEPAGRDPLPPADPAIAAVGPVILRPSDSDASDNSTRCCASCFNRSSIGASCSQHHFMCRTCLSNYLLNMWVYQLDMDDLELHCLVEKCRGTVDPIHAQDGFTDEAWDVYCQNCEHEAEDVSTGAAADVGSLEEEDASPAPARHENTRENNHGSMAVKMAVCTTCHAVVPSEQATLCTKGDTICAICVDLRVAEAIGSPSKSLLCPSNGLRCPAYNCIGSISIDDPCIAPMAREPLLALSGQEQPMTKQRADVSNRSHDQASACCALCFSDSPGGNGVSCHGAPPHFVCTVCLAEYASSEGITVLRPAMKAMRCPEPNCGSELDIEGCRALMPGLFSLSSSPPAASVTQPKVPIAVLARPQPVPPTVDDKFKVNVDILVGMGFEQSHALSALEATQNNVQLAMDLLV